MSRKILGKVEPKCAYCRYGTPAADNERILCPKKGVLDKDFSCKKFSYDPLKRVPQKLPEMQKFSAEDFELEI